LFGSTSISHYHGRNGKMLDIDDNKEVVITVAGASTEQDHETLVTIAGDRKALRFDVCV
jgi:hypothetical protein